MGIKGDKSFSVPSHKPDLKEEFPSCFQVLLIFKLSMVFFHKVDIYFCSSVQLPSLTHLTICEILFSYQCKQKRIDNSSVSLRSFFPIKLETFNAILLNFDEIFAQLFMGYLFTYLFRASDCFLDWSVLIRSIMAFPKTNLATFWLLCIFPKQKK